MHSVLEELHGPPRILSLASLVQAPNVYLPTPIPYSLTHTPRIYTPL